MWTNILFQEARKQYKQFYKLRTYSTKWNQARATQTEDKDTQTDDSITWYTKQKQKNIR